MGLAAGFVVVATVFLQVDPALHPDDILYKFLSRFNRVREDALGNLNRMTFEGERVLNNLKQDMVTACAEGSIREVTTEEIAGQDLSGVSADIGVPTSVYCRPGVPRAQSTSFVLPAVSCRYKQYDREVHPTSTSKVPVTDDFLYRFVSRFDQVIIDTRANNEMTAKGYSYLRALMNDMIQYCASGLMREVLAEEILHQDLTGVAGDIGVPTAVYCRPGGPRAQATYFVLPAVSCRQDDENVQADPNSFSNRELQVSQYPKEDAQYDHDLQSSRLSRDRGTVTEGATPNFDVNAVADGYIRRVRSKINEDVSTHGLTLRDVPMPPVYEE